MKIQENKIKTSYLFFSERSKIFENIAERFSEKKCSVYLFNHNSERNEKRSKNFVVINEKELKNKKIDCYIYIESFNNDDLISKRLGVNHLKDLRLFLSFLRTDNSKLILLASNNNLSKIEEELKEHRQRRPNDTVNTIYLSRDIILTLLQNKSSKTDKSKEAVFDQITHSMLSMGFTANRGIINIISQQEKRGNLDGSAIILKTKTDGHRIRKERFKLKAKRFGRLLKKTKFKKQLLEKNLYTNSWKNYFSGFVLIIIFFILPYLLFAVGVVSVLIEKSQNTPATMYKSSLFLTNISRQTSSIYGQLPLFGNIYNNLSSTSYRLNVIVETNTESSTFKKVFNQELNHLLFDSKENDTKYADHLNLILASLKENIDLLTSFSRGGNRQNLERAFLSKDSKFFYNYEKFSDLVYLFEQLPNISAYSGKKSYLILVEDNGFLRPGGGIVKDAVFVKLEDGRMVYKDFYSADYLDKHQKGFVLSNGQQQKYLDKRLVFENTSWENNLKEALLSSMNYFISTTGEKVDAVIVIDSQAQDFLNNLKLFNDKQDISTNFKTLDYFNTILNLLYEKHIYLFFTDENLQNKIRMLGWGDGKQIVCDIVCKNDFIYLYLSDINNNFSKDSINEEYKITTLIQDKVIKKEMTIVLKNESDTDVKYYLGVVTPAGTSFSDFSESDNENMHLKPAIFNNHKNNEAGIVVDLKRGESKILSFSLEIEKVRVFDKEKNYSFILYKQPGTSEIPVSLNIKTDSALTKGKDVLYNSSLVNDLVINYSPI